MENLEFYSRLGLPYEYKKVNIHPVKVIDVPKFYDVIKVLLFKKNLAQDPQIIKMSYLKFILSISMEDENLYKCFEELMSMVFKCEFDIQKSVLTDNKNKLYLKIHDELFREKDFDKIKEIIFQQNGISVDDEILDPDFEKEMQETAEYMERINGKMATFEEQITIYHCLFNTEYEKIANLTIYQFQKALERENYVIDYKILKSAQMSGMVEFKGEIPHWMSHIKQKGKYEDLTMSKDKFDKLAGDINSPVNSQ